MGTTCVPIRTPHCPALKGCKWGYLVFERKRLEPWQRHYGCHFASFVMYISGATFEEHGSNISRDGLDSIFYRFSCKPCTYVMSSLSLRNI